MIFRIIKEPHSHNIPKLEQSESTYHERPVDELMVLDNVNLEKAQVQQNSVETKQHIKAVLQAAESFNKEVETLVNELIDKAEQLRQKLRSYKSNELQHLTHDTQSYIDCIPSVN